MARRVGGWMDRQPDVWVGDGEAALRVGGWVDG